jgi:hypothetical protein
MVNLKSRDGRTCLTMRVGGSAIGQDLELATVFIRLVADGKSKSCGATFDRPALLSMATQLEKLHAWVGIDSLLHAMLWSREGHLVVSASANSTGAVVLRMTVCSRVQFFANPLLYGQIVLDQTELLPIAKEFRALHHACGFVDD